MQCMKDHNTALRWDLRPARHSFPAVCANHMTENIIQQARDIEAEAERIVAEANKQARELEGSLEARASELRQEHQHAFRQELDAFQEKLQQKTAKAQEELQRKASDATERLENIGSEAKDGAVESILKKLRGG